jgi:hypothetical protein
MLISSTLDGWSFVTGSFSGPGKKQKPSPTSSMAALLAAPAPKAGLDFKRLI